MVFESYGVSKQLCDSNIESTTYLLRCFKYRVPEQDETDLGLHSHTDLTFLSIIHQHLIGGLQVQLLDEQWIDIDPAGHSSFIVMAGDALMVRPIFSVIILNIYRVSSQNWLTIRKVIHIYLINLEKYLRIYCIEFALKKIILSFDTR